MLKKRKTIGGNLGVVKPENRLLRLLRSELSFQVSNTNIAGDIKGDTYRESQREINAALAEAEYQKTKAIINYQQARSFC